MRHEIARPILTKLEFVQWILVKIPHIEFHENLSCGKRVLCGRTDRQAHMTKLLKHFFWERF